MCGRYTHLYTWKQLHRLMNLLSPEVALPPRYNVAPTQLAPVIVRDLDGDAAGGVAGGALLRSMRWGLIPSWAKDPSIGNSLVNARGETIDTKPAFRQAFGHRRCLVPISGFFEWKPVQGRKAKQPLYITPTPTPTTPTPAPTSTDDSLWLLAGLWDSWTSPQGQTVDSFTIITTGPNQAIAEFHDRMPVILETTQARLWIGLDGDAPGPQELKSLLTPFPADRMLLRPVSRIVNSPGTDSPSCIQVVDFQEDRGLFDGQF